MTSCFSFAFFSFVFVQFLLQLFSWDSEQAFSKFLETVEGE